MSLTSPHTTLRPQSESSMEPMPMDNQSAYFQFTTAQLADAIRLIPLFNLHVLWKIASASPRLRATVPTRHVRPMSEDHHHQMSTVMSQVIALRAARDRVVARAAHQEHAGREESARREEEVAVKPAQDQSVAQRRRKKSLMPKWTITGAPPRPTVGTAPLHLPLRLWLLLRSHKMLRWRSRGCAYLKGGRQVLGRHCLLLAKSVFCLDDIGCTVWLGSQS